MIGFEYPWCIAGVLILIPLVVFFTRRTRHAFVLLLPLGAPGGVPFTPPFKCDLILKFLFAMEFLAAVLLILAFGGPDRRMNKTVWLGRGADILFILDISPSMAGLDMGTGLNDGQDNGRGGRGSRGGTSRFDAARNLVREFAARRPTDAIGLAALGNDAALLVPPTVDRRALEDRLERLRLGELGDGTALGMGLAVAARHLRNSSAPRRVAILITDGENNAGPVNPETAATLLAEAGISLWVIGVGSGGEIPIDYVDPFTRMRRTGTFDSRFDETSLLALGKAGGGAYISAPSADALAAAFSRISREELTVSRSGLMIHRYPLHVPLIAAGLALFALAEFIRRFLLGAPA
ncbi:MAG: VWA domain-containing protein [Treponema sp.]|jgi:Ca-activated chloride channel family protein|nr:VWA domain-containing protein [Treponema sp.]